MSSIASTTKAADSGSSLVSTRNDSSPFKWNNLWFVVADYLSFYSELLALSTTNTKLRSYVIQRLSKIGIHSFLEKVKAHLPDQYHHLIEELHLIQDALPLTNTVYGFEERFLNFKHEFIQKFSNVDLVTLRRLQKCENLQMPHFARMNNLFKSAEILRISSEEGTESTCTQLAKLGNLDYALTERRRLNLDEDIIDHLFISYLQDKGFSARKAVAVNHLSERSDDIKEHIINYLCLHGDELEAYIVHNSIKNETVRIKVFNHSIIPSRSYNNLRYLNIMPSIEDCGERSIRPLLRVCLRHRDIDNTMKLIDSIIPNTNIIYNYALGHVIKINIENDQMDMACNLTDRLQCNGGKMQPVANLRLIEAWAKKGEIDLAKSRLQYLGSNFVEAGKNNIIESLAKLGRLQEAEEMEESMILNKPQATRCIAESLIQGGNISAAKAKIRLIADPFHKSLAEAKLIEHHIKSNNIIEAGVILAARERVIPNSLEEQEEIIQTERNILRSLVNNGFLDIADTRAGVENDSQMAIIESLADSGNFDEATKRVNKLSSPISQEKALAYIDGVKTKLCETCS